FVRFLMAHTTHWNTHVHIWRRHRTHTHTHTHADEVTGEICLLPLTHPGVLVLPQGSQEQWAAFFSAGARGPGQVFSPIMVWRVTFFCSSACFSVGVLSGGNPL